MERNESLEAVGEAREEGDRMRKTNSIQATHGDRPEVEVINSQNPGEKH